MLTRNKMRRKMCRTAIPVASSGDNVFSKCTFSSMEDASNYKFISSFFRDKLEWDCLLGFESVSSLRQDCGGLMFGKDTVGVSID